MWCVSKLGVARVTLADSMKSLEIRDWRKRWVLPFGSCAAGLCFLFALPYVIASTSLRDSLLRALVGEEKVIVSSQSASFGYLSPVFVGGIKIASTDQTTEVKVNSVSTSKAWWRLLVDFPQLGHVTLNQPILEHRLDTQRLREDAAAHQQPQLQPQPQSDRIPELSAVVAGGELRLYDFTDAEPLLDVRALHLSLQLQKESGATWLTVTPATVIEHQELTPRLFRQGLQLVTPILANEVDVDGRITLQVDECRVPLEPNHSADTTREATIRGRIAFENVRVGMRNTIMRQVIEATSRLLNVGIPNVVTVAESSDVKFEFREGRVYHDGLTLLIPHGEARSFNLQSSGSVGLDDSLDLTLAVTLPGTLAGKTGFGKLTQFVTSRPVHVRVQGTLDEPKLAWGIPGGLTARLQSLFPEQDQSYLVEQDLNEVIEQVDGTDAEATPNPSATQISDAISDIVGGILNRSRQTDATIETDTETPTFRERLNQMRENRPRLRRRTTD